MVGAHLRLLAPWAFVVNGSECCTDAESVATPCVNRSLARTHQLREHKSGQTTDTNTTLGMTRLGIQPNLPTLVASGQPNVLLCR